jgi:hypothetical protein
VVGALALTGWWLTRSAVLVTVDLIDALPRAIQQRPSPEAFQVIDATLNGETRRAIYVAEQSRIVWEEEVPEHAWLQVALGVREEAWQREGDGVLFLIGVSHAGRYDELISLIVNPRGNESDRQWLPILLDLAPWAGQRVEIIFNTRVAHKDASTANHLALWGAPAIVTR